MKYIFGVNTVREAVINKRVKKVFLLDNFSNQAIIKLLKENKIFINYCSRKELDDLVKGNHQGIVALTKNIEPLSLKDLINKNKDNPNSVFIMLDGLKDPHNLGSIIRSADIFNAQGVIYKKRDSVSINDTVEKVSTGAINYIPCSEVTNLTNTIKELKNNGYWVVGFEGEAKQDITQIPKDVKLCVVIGSEGEGISRLVKENCDLLLKIPMYGHGHVNSLNASVACAIVLYELKRK